MSGFVGLLSPSVPGVCCDLYCGISWTFHRLFEPPHHKTNKIVCPAKTQISLGIRPVWSVFTWRKLGSLVTHWAHSKLWSDWADAQADRNLRWVQRSFCWFLSWGDSFCIAWFIFQYPACLLHWIWWTSSGFNYCVFFHYWRYVKIEQWKHDIAKPIVVTVEACMYCKANSATSLRNNDRYQIAAGDSTWADSARLYG